VVFTFEAKFVCSADEDVGEIPFAYTNELDVVNSTTSEASPEVLG